MSHRGSRPHAGHRQHRRRWSGRPQHQPSSEVRLATITPLADCIPGLPCNWHGTCSICGDTIHLAGGAMSASFGTYTTDELATMIVGDPPRCRECRTGAT
ncbi:MAG TPA: hypothetical protein VFB39_00015 [Solirubrobacteraceae bacterium]|nr:hypothetical protein [Solirubrobacteraceae bacterium]